MSVLNPRITVSTIDGALFQDEVEQRKVLAWPTVFLNGELFDSGRMSMSRSSASSHRRRRPRCREDERQGPFDVLVIGAAGRGDRRHLRRAQGLRTGLAAERFGGQVLDPMRSRTSSRCRTPRAPAGGRARAARPRVRRRHHAHQEATELVPATEVGGLTE
jgi:alkyl hydroperoxide reductase subunit F